MKIKVGQISFLFVDNTQKYYLYCNFTEKFRDKQK